MTKSYDGSLEISDLHDIHIEDENVDTDAGADSINVSQKIRNVGRSSRKSHEEDKEEETFFKNEGNENDKTEKLKEKLKKLNDSLIAELELFKMPKTMTRRPSIDGNHSETDYCESLISKDDD